MALRIAQSQQYLGDDYWSWAVWIDGSPSELDQIDEVTWYLHPTFPDPVQVRRDRARQFRLESRGWGVFEIRSEISLRNGSTLGLSHMLELRYPDERAATARAAERTARVYLSYSAEDAREARQLRDELIELNVEVLDPDGEERGSNRADSPRRAMQSSDMVVGIVSGDYPSSWVLSELSEAQALSKPLYPIVVGEGSDSALTGLEFHRVERLGDNASDVAHQIRALLDESG